MTKALVIIDMIKGQMKDTKNPKTIIKNQINLIKEFNKSNYKVIFVRPGTDGPHTPNPVMLRLWGDESKDDPEYLYPVEELAGLKYDRIIKKPEYSAFYRTDLEEYLKDNNIDEVYLAGVFAGCCVYFTAVDAVYRHIQPYLITDACGFPVESLTSSGWKQNTLDRFKLMLGPLITTAELIEEISK